MPTDREPLNTDGFRFAINQIDDGFIFEIFGLSFLGATLGYNFAPVGGVKDKGIDGLEYIFNKEGFKKNIYQLSTELNSEGKLDKSIQKLIDNKIPFDSITYVTNRVVSNKDALIDKLFDKFKKHLNIYDQNWFVSNANHSAATINAYYTFIDSHLHEFSKPGKSYVVSDLANDSRLFVFLRQQLDSKRNDLKLDDLLADTLILFGLGTVR